MPTSSARVGEARALTERGFSLVELMMVIALIGLAATAVMLTFPAGSGDAAAQAGRFAARAAALRDRAVVEGRPMRLWVSASGYGFDQRVDGGWQPLDDRSLTRADWSAGTAISVDSNAADTARGQLSFNRTGLPSAPLTLTLRNGAQAQTLRITAAGEVELR